jgi:RND family efflux transporter MFP subunit
MESAAEIGKSPGPASLWQDMERLAASTVPPKEFWSRLALLVRDGTGAAVVLGMHRGGGTQAWRVIASAVDGAAARRLSGEEFVKMAPDLAGALTEGGAFPRMVRMSDGREMLIPGATVTVRREGEQAALLALCPAQSDATALDAQIRAAALVPPAYEARLSLERAEEESRSLTSVLDVVALTNAAGKFGEAALAFCNALATRCGCDRVSLGWHHAGYAKVAAVSRHEHVDRKMEMPQLIEAAMDECLDQDQPVVWPAPADAAVVSRDHEKLAAENGGENVLTVPLGLEAKPLGAVLCERAAGAFTPAEVTAVRLAAAQCAPRLAGLKACEGWAGRRFVRWLREWAAGLLGPRHTLAKLTALFITVLLAVLVFWHTAHRVEGNFLLRSEKVSNLTTPVDGFISEVLVESGDQVKAGQVMLRLNTEALKVEESAAQAELERYSRETDRARAAGATAEMQIAATMKRQAQAKLDVVRYRLNQAEIRSTMDGVVIEGDLRERIDAPVKQGDLLFRVAQLSGYYVDIQLDERDAQDVTSGAAGELAFLSQPERSLPVKVSLVLPSAVEKDGLSVFAARAAFETPEEPWWRPGMSGVAKINVGERSLLWIITHRTIDFLRMKLWW